MRTEIFIMILALYVFLLMIVKKSGTPLNRHRRKKGKPVPDFSLTSLEGNKLTRDTLKGKVVILCFWATWAPACREATHQNIISRGWWLLVSVSTGGQGRGSSICQAKSYNL